MKLYSRWFFRVSVTAIAFAALGAAAGSPTADKVKKTYCAYYLPTGNHRVWYCTPKPVHEAQRECDATLKEKKIEGTCSCTDDEGYINGRCG